jgi:predicted DsbA family dithiol-disulfide isomerase
VSSVNSKMAIVGQVTEIDVFADVWCPFTYVGLRAVDARRARLDRPDVSLHLRAWPLELVNGRRQNPLAIAAHIRELREQVAPTLFQGFDPGHYPRTTLPALALTATAYRCGNAIGEAVGLAIRAALFERGVDISAAAELALIASEFDLPITTDDDGLAVLADWREGQSRGVVGSPHFFCDHLDLSCSYPDAANDQEGRTQSLLNAERLDEFLETCFETGD